MFHWGQSAAWCCAYPLKDGFFIENGRERAILT